MMAPIFTFRQGTAPLLISFPHVGIQVPADISSRLAPEAHGLLDTDWHVDLLYDFADAIGASTLVAGYSRYVVDLNRPADDANLYPGQAGTGLIPEVMFDGTPLYLPAQGPDDAEKAARVATYWQPYHAQLSTELARLKARHGYALLWDAHSIAAEVPRLFDGRLPDLNLGSNAGASCAPAFADAVFQVTQTSGYSAVLNGRFKGGHVTRHYGRPAEHVHALQLELSQDTHLAPGLVPALDEGRCSRLRPVLRQMIATFLSSAAAYYAAA
ncbi:N-formylglutamate deformylase [Nitrospirillum amazonense]|uniref:N-formylglutamate deformylase n=1 Tax=Nitrospirillum amazonense TaxID=28077 RepID=A0A560JFG5_9PROT|nr:N-formylglutamate deformylase [Nitrospirillum amazonense]MDG3439314.1 N-formylglutamate deformylase [Nitrospirillum amazonense]TWB69892.1 N-formylglutamate deformylase [Nitrospirillum amazonense]